MVSSNVTEPNRVGVYDTGTTTKSGKVERKSHGLLWALLAVLALVVIAYFVFNVSFT